MTYHKAIFTIVIALIFVMSVFTLTAFAIDKRRAQKGRERVKEKTLLTMTALFGAIGALIGREIAHHKTAKVYFSIVIWFSLILQAALIGYTAYLAFIY